jgi:hypothetical protein
MTFNGEKQPITVTPLDKSSTKQRVCQLETSEYLAPFIPTFLLDISG